MISPDRKEIVDMDAQEQEALLRRAEAAGVSAEDLSRFRAVFDSYEYVSSLIAHKEMNLSRLRSILFGSRSEKTRDVLRRGPGSRNTGTPSATNDANAEQPAASTGATESTGAPATPPAVDAVEKQKSPGHGRRGADDLPGAERVPITHPTLKPGGACPECDTGVLYQLLSPMKLIRFTGNPPLSAKIYELQKLRCNLCGKVFRAPTPPSADEKYDPSVATTIGVLKYGAGFPFYRLARIQDYVAQPLAAATQWSLVVTACESYQPIFEALIRVAAQGDVLYNDDTTVKILEHMGRRSERARDAETMTAATENSNSTLESNPDPTSSESDIQAEPTSSDNSPDRTGLFTTSVVATDGQHRIALYFSGNRHAGENLNEVLRRRAVEHPPPIQMCDALSRNYPREFKTIVGNCLSHARRKFVEIHSNFAQETTYVMEQLSAVYRHDQLAREQSLGPNERLAYHQHHSGPVMEQLHAWFKRQFSERLVESNSALGAAINYLLKHWPKFTLFLRQPGAPLDNNIAERALKKAILHRKNSLFYLTDTGAKVGDIHMSLIHTCELNDVNPFDYLTALQQNAEAVADAPEQWLPWSYHDSLLATLESETATAIL